MIAVGDKVYLKACRTGEPGTVIRAERKRLVVYWLDMDHWSRHRPESLVLATNPERSASESNAA